jgi:hypothetical protein
VPRRSGPARHGPPPATMPRRPHRTDRPGQRAVTDGFCPHTPRRSSHDGGSGSGGPPFDVVGASATSSTRGCGHGDLGVRELPGVAALLPQ